MIDRLMDKKKLDGGEQAYLDALCDLVVVYEDQHNPIPVASDADLLRHLMEAKGVTQIQIHKDTGLAKSGISENSGRKKRLLSRIRGGILARGELRVCERGRFSRLPTCESRMLFWWSVLLCC